MSQKNVEHVRQGYEALEKGDMDRMLEALDSDIEWDYSRSSFPEAGVYHGRDGVREWFRGLGEAFANLHWEVREITDLGGDQVLGIIRVQGQGQYSEIEVDYIFATVSTLRDGKVSRVDRYDTRAEALEAVGRREQG